MLYDPETSGDLEVIFMRTLPVGWRSFFCRGMPGGGGYRSGQGLRGIQLGSVRVERKRDARGRGYRPGQGLRRVIQLRFREMAKSIAAGPELAVGSNS